MKYALLYALSFVLMSQSPASAEDGRSAAGAQGPVRLGGENRLKQQEAVNAARQAAVQATKKDSTKGGGKSTEKSPDGKTESKASASGGKSLIPPPPDLSTITGGKGKRRAKRKTPEAEGQAGAQAGPEDKMVTVGSGGPFKFTGRSRDQFLAAFDWKPDDKDDQLTLTAKFSPVDQASKAAHFNWLRVTLGNRMLATEQTLKGKSELKIDLTGSVEDGANQIAIEGQGMSGATLEWKLTTPKKLKLSSVNPDEVVVGQDLTLKGENFDPNSSKDTITLGKKTFNPNTATNVELKLRIPADFPPGDYTVKVAANGLTSKELKVTVRGIPELTGTSLNGVPPGAQLIIYGKNFSKKLHENKVTFDGQQAEVVGGGTEQLTVVVPNFYTGLTNDTAGIAGQVGIPIKVKVGKVDSKNSVPINVGNSTWQDPGLRTGPDVPTVPVDWRRLLEN